MGFPLFMEIFPFLWEFEKTCALDKGYVFSNKWELSLFYWNLPLLMGIFPFLWEFEKSLLSWQRLRVQ